MFGCILTISACTIPLPDDYVGNVVEVTDRIVKIEGVQYDGKPSLAMQEMAERLCRGESEFVGVTPKPGSGTITTYGPFGPTYTTGSSGVRMWHYTFACI